MTRWFCLFFERHKWRYLSDFTSRQCQICKSRQRAWLKDSSYVWLPEGKLPVACLNAPSGVGFAGFNPFASVSTCQQSRQRQRH